MPVWNLEVHGYHTYHAGATGLLVHNAGNCKIIESKPHGNDQHWADMQEQARKMYESGDYAEIYLNMGIRRSGVAFDVNYRPDVWGIRHDGLIDAFERLSPGQSARSQREKLNDIMDILGVRAGKRDLIPLSDFT